MKSPSINKTPTQNDSLKIQYPIIIRVALLGSLIPLIGLMLFFPRFDTQSKPIHSTTTLILENVDIHITVQPEKLIRPELPKIPIESEDPDFEGDETIVLTDLGEIPDWKPILTPPPPDIPFVDYDEEPKPIGGYSAIMKRIVYPEIAREFGIEGTVVIKAFVDKNGNVTDNIVIRGVPNTGLNEAALSGIKKTKFIPAKQRDIVVGVWITITISFKLKG